jgi:hypothetical protein
MGVTHGHEHEQRPVAHTYVQTPGSDAAHLDAISLQSRPVRTEDFSADFLVCQIHRFCRSATQTDTVWNRS